MKKIEFPEILKPMKKKMESISGMIEKKWAPSWTRWW
jgi:hypothetical protein